MLWFSCSFIFQRLKQDKSYLNACFLLSHRVMVIFFTRGEAEGRKECHQEVGKKKIQIKISFVRVQEAGK